MFVPGYDTKSNFMNQFLPQQQQMQQNALLKNQVSQIPITNALQQEALNKAMVTNQFLPQSLQAKMALQQAEAEYNQAHAKNLPLANQLGWARLAQQQQMYSPEYIQLRNAQIRQLVEQPGRFLSKDGKQLIERDRLASGLNAAGTPNTLNNITATAPNVKPVIYPAPQPINPQQNPGQQNALTMSPQQTSALQGVVGNPGAVNSLMQPPSLGNAPSQNQNMQQAQAPQQPIITDAGDLMAPHYANNPGLLQFDIQANKKSVPTQTWQQLSAARQLEGYANSPQVRNSLAAYAQYAGILGRGEAFMESLKRDKPDIYKRAMEAKTITISNLANLQRRLENLGVQESTREEIKGNFDGAIKNMTSDPKLSLYLMNAALKQMNQVTSQVYATAQPVRQVYAPHPFQPIMATEGAQPLDATMSGQAAPIMNHSAEDIRHTAQKYNMTEAQVKQRLGIK